MRWAGVALEEECGEPFADGDGGGGSVVVESGISILYQSDLEKMRAVFSVSQFCCLGRCFSLSFPIMFVMVVGLPRIRVYSILYFLSIHACMCTYVRNLPNAA